MNKSKVAVSIHSFWSTVAIVAGVIFLLGFVGSLTSSSFDGSTIPALPIGLFLLFLGIRGKKLISTFKNYVRLLAADPKNSISNLAAKTGKSPETVRKNLAKMIKKKYFSNAWIDEENDSLVLTKSTDQILKEKAQQASAAAVQAPAAAAPAQAPVPTVSVKCKGCGAICSVPKGGSAECEYCGNIVSA